MPSSMTRQPSFTTGKKMNSMMSCRAEDRRNHASRDLAAKRDGHSASLKVNRRPGTFTSSAARTALALEWTASVGKTHLRGHWRLLPLVQPCIPSALLHQGSNVRVRVCLAPATAQQAIDINVTAL